MTATALSPDLADVQAEVRRFVREEVQPHADAWEREGQVPRDVLRRMGDLGWFSLRVPEQLGGLGLGAAASAAFAEALASSTYGGFDATVLVHTDMASPHLVRSGDEAQLARWLPGVLSGEVLTAIAVTEPDAGSDVAGMRTVARRDGDRWVLHGAKTFITNGASADLLIVAARTDPEARHGISMFLVPRDAPGLSVSRRLDKTGWRCSDTAELHLDQVVLGDEDVLGTVHRGFYETMANFQNERLVLVGMAVGSAQAAIDLTLRWTRDRHAFGQPLFAKGGVRQRLAMLQAKVDLARAGMYAAAGLLDEDPRGDAAVRAVSGAKAVVCELANEVMYTCVQFHGGMGYMRENPVERMSRDARVLAIGGGATEVMLEEIAKRMTA